MTGELGERPYLSFSLTVDGWLFRKPRRALALRPSPAPASSTDTDLLVGNTRHV